MLFPETVFRVGTAALAAGVVAEAASDYALVDVFDKSNFFKEFEFFDESDPTNGFVKYVDARTANDDSLAGYYQDSVYLGVDHTKATTTGRESVRVESKKSYTQGLFVADISHMPAGVSDAGSCGLWPAFWMFGPDWPNSGEIDILEGVNTQSSNAITLHTAPGCHMTNTGSLATTKLLRTDCNGQEGCSQNTQATNNYGAGFNAAGGGVYVVEWTSTAISLWFFGRNSSIASELANNNSQEAPDTSEFGQPLAVFVGGASGSGCDIDSHFQNHSLVFDTTFCGDWAGKVWAQDDTCSALAPSCSAYVGSSPSAFANAYWLVKSIKVYQKPAGANEKRSDTRLPLPFIA
ncbi:endo-1,3(4)-beta-glucanase-like protein [Lasiosphaeria miniovina]|uniref:endo-1,3(4)-beta-glucanase n=1 Tax=Lasiosphaeria miniovina TaxID=1954250 RepID=A0AA40DK52_9PEZI|nr:endo-1,3(4)-beta-glucanase-like protein [Lasiosphaeria miniovina]KAK0703777.1 endo-1,3(4)-beta-glucanase-like protein [Lasiosphaeria miniovina]